MPLFRSSSKNLIHGKALTAMATKVKNIENLEISSCTKAYGQGLPKWAYSFIVTGDHPFKHGCFPI